MQIGISLMYWPWFEPAAAGVDVLVVVPFGDRAALVDALAQHNCVTAQPGGESRRFR